MNWKLWQQNPFNISNLIIHQCAADGNCQFSSLANTLETHSDQKKVITGDIIRKLVGHSVIEEKNVISNEDVSLYIKMYQLEKTNSEFMGNWNPDEVFDREDLGKAILSPYYNDMRQCYENNNTNGHQYQFSPNYMKFQGDAITLAIFIKTLEINVIVFDYDKKYAQLLEYIDPRENENKGDDDLYCLSKYPTICVLQHYLSSPSVNKKINSGLRHYAALGINMCDDQNDQNDGEGEIKSLFLPNELPKTIINYLKSLKDRRLIN